VHARSWLGGAGYLFARAARAHLPKYHLVDAPGEYKVVYKKKNFTTNGKGTLIGGKKGSIQWKVARHFPMNAPFF
jgi:hypothetical protein